MILADENISFDLVNILRSHGIQVDHIKEIEAGISDKQVIELSKSPAKIILTEDKDFGEWVYAHKEENISVIFLRYSFQDSKLIIQLLIDLILNKGNDLYGKFTTITPHKIRIRSLK